MMNTSEHRLHLCTYTGYCPHQHTCGKLLPAPLPAPAHNQALALEVGAPSYQTAINQLQELAQHGYTDLPVYDFSLTQDAEGRMTWHCRCTLRGWGESTASFPTKRLAKHAAAFEMLCRVLAF